MNTKLQLGIIFSILGAMLVYFIVKVETDNEKIVAKTMEQKKLETKDIKEINEPIEAKELIEKPKEVKTLEEVIEVKKEVEKELEIEKEIVEEPKEELEVEEEIVEEPKEEAEVEEEILEEPKEELEVEKEIVEEPKEELEVEKVVEVKKEEYKTKVRLNIRANPYVGNNKIGVLPSHKIVKAVECNKFNNKNWCKIKYQELVGWVSQDFLIKQE